jgi:hypothetical protein
VALIQFDFGEIIATNQVDPHDPAQGTDPTKEALITIDAGPPQSSVIPLPAIISHTEIELNWTGSDDRNGSGIDYVEFYASADGNPFAKIGQIEPDSGAHSFVYTGTLGEAYRFYSIAVDNVGHREALPSSPDTSTLVVVLGDMNFDGQTNYGDLSPFVVALTDPVRYQSELGNAPATAGDINRDGRVNFVDIHGLVNILGRATPARSIAGEMELGTLADYTGESAQRAVEVAFRELYGECGRRTRFQTRSQISTRFQTRMALD